MAEFETLYTELTADDTDVDHRLAVLRYEAVISRMGGKSTLILAITEVANIYEHYTLVMNWLMPAGDMEPMLSMSRMLIPEKIAGDVGKKWDEFRAYCWQQVTEKDRADAVKFVAELIGNR